MSWNNAVPWDAIARTGWRSPTFNAPSEAKPFTFSSPIPPLHTSKYMGTYESCPRCHWLRQYYNLRAHMEGYAA